MSWLKCYHCKVEFGLHDETERQLRMSSANFHCPYGHVQHFPKGETEADKLRRERDRLKQNEAWYEQRNRELRAEAESERRRAAAARGQVTKLKNRAAAGLCPCCNRSFVNLQRHMATKHAAFRAEPIEGATIQ